MLSCRLKSYLRGSLPFLGVQAAPGSNLFPQMCQRHLLNRAEDVEAIIDRPRGTSATNLLPYGAVRSACRIGRAMPAPTRIWHFWGERGSNFLAIPRLNPDWAEDRGTIKCWEKGNVVRSICHCGNAPKAPLCKGSWQNRLFGTDFD